jgi:long-chain fatty acid transport protein
MKQRMTTVRLLLTVALIALTGISLSANGLNLNGQGSKAIAMGGAFIGQADDYSAIFWNPAGLTQMKKSSLSLFITDLLPTGTYVFPTYGIDAQTKAGMYPSGSFSYFKPINEKLVIGISAYVPAGSGAEWDVEDLKPLSYNITAGKAGNTLIWKSMIGVISASPVASYRISDRFSVGASLNFNYAFLKLQKPATFRLKIPPVIDLKFAEQYKEDSTAFGIGATFGMMFKPIDQLSIGLTVRTPVTIKFKGDASNDIASNTFIQISAPGIPTESAIERKATWPLWAGLGLSFKPMDKLTLNADVQFTQWSKVQAIEAVYENPMWQALFAAGGKLDLKWDDAIQYRFGLEYAVSEKLALRAGYYYDPTPSPVETLSILLPEFTYNVVTAGFGYKTEKISLDFCIEALMGKDVESPLAGGTMPGTHGMNILVPNIAFTYRF